MDPRESDETPTKGVMGREGMIQNKELSSSALLTCERMVCNVKLQASSSYSHENDQSLLLIFLRSYMFSLEF